MSRAALAGLDGAADATAARIGPNAITRVAAALQWLHGEGSTNRVFARAGLLAYMTQPPQHMVDEAEVMRLHAALRTCVGEAQASLVSHEAGRRTADYLLTHRIPRPAQVLLKLLPARLAARVLLQAVSRHAWTFAGSGRFAHLSDGSRIVLTLHDNPLCRGVVQDEPACAYYAATFERLFQVLVHPRARVVETQCEACGAGHCRFEVEWPR
jgi:divinyl protochlorophyllide a 8-vinyl-reductase